MVKRSLSLAVAKAKLVVKQLLYEKFEPKTSLDSIYNLFEPSEIIERTLMLADKPVLVKSLDMQSAPGTTEMIINLLGSENKDIKLLDYGCGNHRSKYLKKIGFDVTSCDIFDDNFDGYVQVDPKSTKLPFADKQFDVAIISEVVEHVENPWGILAELQRVTKNRIIVTTPNTVSKKSKELFVKSNYFYWFTPDVEYHITPIFYWQMENFCKRQGLQLESTLGNHQVYYPDSENVLQTAETLIFDIKV